MKTLIRPLLLGALVVSMVAPTAIASAQRYREGYIVTVNPNLRRVWHHRHWRYMHRHRLHGAWVWR